MKLGYIRVSTKEQHPERQIQELIRHGVEERFLFIDYITGKKQDRPKYDALKLMLRKGDELYIHELDRLGRSKKLIYEELEYLKKQGVIVRILDVPTTLMDYETHGEMSKLIFDMINNLLLEVLSTLAEHELKKIKKRQVEGIAAAKMKGIRFGRKPACITDDFVVMYGRWKNKEISATNAALQLGICRATYYKLVKKYESATKKEG